MPVASEHAAGGPYYLAWVDAGETFGPEHLRYDDYVFAFERVHEEGQPPTLRLDILNPKQDGTARGLLAPGRKRNIFFAVQDGSEATLLFAGRVMSLPGNLNNAVVTVAFEAIPPDAMAQKSALADALKQLPLWDPVCIDPTHRDNPEAIFEAYPARWHYDPAGGPMTTSHILAGEDGIETFGPDAIFHDTLTFEFPPPPLSAVEVEVNVEWTQQATGVIDFGSFAFVASGGLASAWPAPGAKLRAGWSVESSSVRGTFAPRPVSYNISYQNRAKTHADGDLMSFNEDYNGFGDKIQQITYTEFTIGDPTTGTPASSRAEGKLVKPWFPNAVTTLALRYDAKRKRKEAARFTLIAGIQDTPHATPAGEPEIVTVHGVDVGLPLDDSSEPEIPIGDLSRRAYFPTDRGLSTLEHAILRGAAHLSIANRIGRVAFECPIERLYAMTLRKNAVVQSLDLPGGEVLGKVVSCIISGDGDSGQFLGRLEIACTIGTGAALEFSEGEDAYIDDDYIDDYYVRDGQVIAVGAGAVGYTPPIDAPNDDGLVFPLTKNQAVVTLAVHPGEEAEELTATIPVDGPGNPPTLNPGTLSHNNLISQRLELTLAWQKSLEERARRLQSTWLELELVTVTNGPFETAYDIATTELTLPKQIDLSA